MGSGPRMLIVGGGYGMHTALRLERLLRPAEATVMIADPRSYMTYQPLLAEAAAGNLKHPCQDFRAALRVIATGPDHQTSLPGTDEKEDDHHAYHR